ncbi:MAG: helix-turn-helix transcriptional regulator [Blautia sp.]|nr:helix-turn-helix transcriptional regulator [Blautia sp.]
MKKQKKRIELRYYEAPKNEFHVALYGESWKRVYQNILHIHNLMEIGLCLGGRGTLKLDKEARPYHPEMLSVIPANYPHYTQSEGNHPCYWEYLFVDVEKLIRYMYPDDEIYQRRMIERLSQKAVFRTTEELSEVAGLVKEILAEDKQKKELYRDKIRGLLSALMISLIRVFDEKSGMPERIQKKESFHQIKPCLEYIDNHYAEELKIGVLADICHMSESNFRKIFVENMNMPPLEYINRRRILQACSLLKHGNLMVEDIALKTGFTTISTFNRNFKRLCGVSPIQWRKEHDNYEISLKQFGIAVEKGW